MSMITYRMQDKNRSLEALLDPEQQYSFSMGNQDEDVRHGVSGMASIHELAAYLAVMAIEATSPVLVRIEGPLSGDTPCDEAMGEYLTLPTSAEIVADDFQMLDCGGQPLYHAVAKKVEQWNTTGQLGLVIGGTYPKELASVRALTPELNFLVPGIGAQGGDINACVQSGMNAQKTGMVINSSRAILYASSGEDFKEKARAVAMQTRDAINAARGL